MLLLSVTDAIVPWAIPDEKADKTTLLKESVRQVNSLIPFYPSLLPFGFVDSMLIIYVVNAVNNLTI